MSGVRAQPRRPVPTPVPHAGGGREAWPVREGPRRRPRRPVQLHSLQRGHGAARLEAAMLLDREGAGLPALRTHVARCPARLNAHVQLLCRRQLACPLVRAPTGRFRSGMPPARRPPPARTLQAFAAACQVRHTAKCTANTPRFCRESGGSASRRGAAASQRGASFAGLDSKFGARRC